MKYTILLLLLLLSCRTTPTEDDSTPYSSLRFTHDLQKSGVIFTAFPDSSLWACFTVRSKVFMTIPDSSVLHVFEYQDSAMAIGEIARVGHDGTYCHIPVSPDTLWDATISVPAAYYFRRDKVVVIWRCVGHKCDIILPKLLEILGTPFMQPP